GFVPATSPPYHGGRSPVRWYLAELPQGRNAARAGELFQVRGGPLCVQPRHPPYSVTASWPARRNRGEHHGRRTSMDTTKKLAMLLVLGLGAAACSEGTDPGRPERTDDPDHAEAREYFDSYAMDADQDRAAGGPAAGVADSAGEPGVGIVPEPPPPPPGPEEDNTFTDVGHSAWVATEVDPQSTFALDVDTGSFRVAHAMLAEGLRPPPESIRVEEWVNYFAYADPPAEDAALGLHVDT